MSKGVRPRWRLQWALGGHTHTPLSYLKGITEIFTLPSPVFNWQQLMMWVGAKGATRWIISAALHT